MTITVTVTTLRLTIIRTDPIRSDRCKNTTTPQHLQGNKKHDLNIISQTRCISAINANPTVDSMVINMIVSTAVSIPPIDSNIDPQTPETINISMISN